MRGVGDIGERLVHVELLPRGGQVVQVPVVLIADDAPQPGGDDSWSHADVQPGNSKETR